MNIKNVDPDKIKIDEKSYKNIFISYIGCVRIKDSKYIEMNSVNPLYFITTKINGYFEEINENDSNDKIKQIEELWSKIRDLIKSITKFS